MSRPVRSLIGFLALVVALVAILAFVAVPIVVRPVVADAGRASSPFADEDLAVDVDATAFGLLVGGIDRIHVSGANLDADGPTIGSLDLEVKQVSARDHSFRAIAGSLTNVEVESFDGSPVIIERIDLSGPSERVEAVAHLDERASVALVGSAFADAGLAVDGIELTDGAVAITLFGQRADLPLAVDDGALVLPNVLGTGELVLLQPEPDDPWRLSGVTVAATGMTVVATFDANGVLGSE
jgi:hypothetical protein